MNTTNISASKAVVVKRVLTVDASLTSIEIERVFNKVRSHGISCDTNWSWGEEVIPRKEGATILYFNTPTRVWKTNIVKDAVRQVLAERPQA